MEKKQAVVVFVCFSPSSCLYSLCVYVSVFLCQDEDMSAELPSRTAVTAHPVAERLDTLMAVMMAYVKDVCHVNGS